MITFQHEPLHEVAGEVDSLLELHYLELTQNKDRVKLNPRWDQYAVLQRLGALIVLTARDGDKLVGYAAFFVNRHMHHADLTLAVNDVLFLHPDYRQGTTGLRLVKFCEDSLKAAGADKLCFHAKLHTSLIPILHRRGYSTEEIVLGKFL